MRWLPRHDLRHRRQDHHAGRNRRSQTAAALAVQADGKILLGGTAIKQLARRLRAGTLQRRWQPRQRVRHRGKVIVPAGSRSSAGHSVMVQPDGRILIGGYARNGNRDFALARLNADGSLDTSFGLADTLGGTVAYTENARPFVLDADIALFDAELSAAGSYAGTTLTLARQGGANADDRFSIVLNGSPTTLLDEGATLVDVNAASGP